VRQCFALPLLFLVLFLVFTLECGRGFAFAALQSKTAQTGKTKAAEQSTAALQRKNRRNKQKQKRQSKALPHSK